jgi:hypothetical protein
MVWSLYAIFHSLFRAMQAEVSRRYHADSWQLAFLQSLVSVLVLVPFMALVKLPMEASFYMAAILVALIITIGQVVQLNLSSEQNGRISGISIPFEAAVGLLLWSAIDSSYWQNLSSHPLQWGGALVAFIVAIAGLFLFRRHDVNLRTLLVMAPVACTYAVAGVVIKIVMPEGEALWPAIISFLMILSLTMTLVMGLLLVVKHRVDGQLFALSTLKAGAVNGIVTLLALGSFVAAVFFAPNPGFASLISVLVPVWIYFYHRIRGINDQSRPFAASLIILSVIILITSTLF